MKAKRQDAILLISVTGVAVMVLRLVQAVAGSSMAGVVLSTAVLDLT